MQALIAAAGFGTRLKPLTNTTPKSLLEIQGRPVIEYVLDKVLSLQQIESVTIISNAKFYRQFQMWLNGYSHRDIITLVNNGVQQEREARGAVADKAMAIEKAGIDGTLLDVHGDILFDFSLKPFVEYFDTQEVITVGLYDVASKERAKKSGVVLLDKEQNILELEEKPAEPKSTLVCMGAYIYPGDKLNLFRQFLAESTHVDNQGEFIRWAINRTQLKGYTFHGRWFDIGTVDELEYARRLAATGMFTP
jgi:glucose-1-phosphate thymidylyltransferase